MDPNATERGPKNCQAANQPIKLLSVVLNMAAATLFLACSSSSDSRAAVRDFQEILATDVDLEISGASAQVRLETTIDVVCSVVYGIDESYGSQSTDLDMAGRGHSSHAPVLRGLEPDTDYHFRLQGTAADGTVYVSADMSFRTPAASETAADRTNLASLAAGARIVEASSFLGETSNWQPENAIDGDPETEWSSAGDGDDAFITIELAETSRIVGIGFWTRTMGSSAQIASFRVLTDDGETFGPFDVPDGSRMYEFALSTTAQQLRFEVISSSGGNTGVIETAVFSEE